MLNFVCEIIIKEVSMNLSIYSYSLCAALPLMLFFGFYFMFGRTPDKSIFSNYLRSRRIMGVALLLLAANYSVHFFFEIRYRDVNSAITMNLSTYFLCYWLFSSALTTLLDRFYITRRRLTIHLLLWILFTAISVVVLIYLPEGNIQNVGLLLLASWLVVYGIVLAMRLIKAYKRAVVLFEDSHSDDIGTYIRWLSFFTWWAVIYGVGCGLFTFLPDEYVFIWILSSVPFYIYLFCSYMNYLLFYEQVESVFESEMLSGELSDLSDEQKYIEAPSHYAEISEKISAWIDAEGYITPGLTVKELSETLHTNRTYLSGYIKSTYNVSFRDWITGLRMEYAKRLLDKYPELTIADISARSGFQSPSHFIRLFREREGFSPAKWRKTKS